jgi:HPt (histidine-containing phosphotransfer) domain-containing protein
MPEPEHAVDTAALDALLEMVGNDAAFLEELVDTFLEDAVTQLDAMRAAVAAGDVESLVRPAHSLKTNSANMGATVLSAMCRELETEARSGSLEGAAERVAAAGREFDAVKAELLERRGAST